MTNAKSGLRTALARGASGAVAAIAELTAEDILSGISEETRTSLAASFGATPAVAAGSADASASEMPDDDTADGDCSECGKAKKDGKCQCASDDADADAAAVPLATNASVHERVKVVAASDAAKANPAAALEMLADDDLISLSADAVIKLVGKSAPAPDGENEDRASAEILAAISASGNSGIDAGGGADAAKGEVNAATLWGKVHGRMAETSNN